MAIPTLAELISKNYTGDVEGLEIVNPVTPTSSAIVDISPVSPSSPNPVETSTKIVPSYLEDADRKLTKEEGIELKETEKEYNESLAFIKDAIAPAMMRIDATKLQIGDTYIRTIFTYAYPDVLE